MTSRKEPDDRPQPAWPQLFLRRADQAAASAVVCVSLAILGGWWLWQEQVRGRRIDIDRAEPVAVEFRIDVNQADWPARATGNLFGTGRLPALAPIA
jgi:hypothetical protein